MSCPSGGDDPQSPARDRLATLPEELLQQIFTAVGRTSKRDLCSVSRLNNAYHVLADAVLYRSIRFANPEHHLRYGQSLVRRPRRGSAIQDVSLSYPAAELSRLVLDAPVALDGLSHTIATMSNLETLEVAVPASLLHGIGTLFNGPFDLACLKKCSLFYQCEGDAYWDLAENIHIFAHPTLESVIIKRAKLDYRGFDSMERPHATALRKLHLVECDINDDALCDILEFPAALREFVMTQAPEPSPELEESSDDVGHYFFALKSAAHSLETVTMDFPTLVGYKSLRMRDFVALRTLRFNWDHQLFGKSSRKLRLHSVGLPPELETLELFNELGTDEEVNDLLLYTIQTKDITARRLKAIIVPGDEGVSKELVEACKSQNLHLYVIGGMDEEKIHEEEGRQF